MFLKFLKKSLCNKNKKIVINEVIYTLFNKEHFIYIYLPVSVILIFFSPIVFMFFNGLSIGFLLYANINKRNLFIINIFFLFI